MHAKNILPALLTLLLVRSAAFAAPAPNAEQTLQGMSAKLTAARQFSFRAVREIDPALLDGNDFAKKANIKVNVSRPNQISAQSASAKRVLRIIADGEKLTVFNAAENHYAQVPMATDIDGLVVKLETIYGFAAPLADFAVSNPYQMLRRQADTVSYLGEVKLGGGLFGIGGVACHRIGLQGKQADAELWIAVSDMLPRKLVATFKESASHPQVRITFTDWDLTTPISASEFTFTPPKDAEKIEMWTNARMNAANKR